ncbi:MAG: RdgB/HAM1 family non-canonical purine NTP pyrophosphatase [Pseudomonadota bacterium]
MKSSARPQQVVLASGNPGKLAEFNTLLAHWSCEIIPQSALAVVPAEETGNTFVENALLKARAAAEQTGLPAIADDSGLSVDALEGAPGVYSARYAGAEATAADNNRKLLAAMADVPPAQRGARFHCALVYLRDADDQHPIICEAQWEGSILTAPYGDGGFGYDPIFRSQLHGCSAAALDNAQKNRDSHRGKALTALLKALDDEFCER